MYKRQLVAPIKILILAILFFFIFLGQIVHAAEKEIDISTNPNGYLFKVGNLKPGDWMPRDITIMNEGTQDFRYMATLGKKKTVKGLLEELDLIVKKGEEVLFEGKMNDFTGFSPRELAKGSSEMLFFQVSMPSDLGNSFQNSEAEVEILFVAEAIGEPGGGGPPPDGGNPPPDGGNPPPDGGNPSGGGDPSDGGDTSSEGSASSENTEDPTAENSQSEEVKSEDKNPADSSDKIVVSPEMRENLLPNTATNTYNLLLIGGVLLASGAILFLLYFRKFRRVSLEKA